MNRTNFLSTDDSPYSHCDTALDRGWDWTQGRTVGFLKCRCPLRTSNGYRPNCGSVEDTHEVFAPNGVFGVSLFNGIVQTCLQPTPVAMVTKIGYIRHLANTKEARIESLHLRFQYSKAVNYYTWGVIQICLRPTPAAMVTDQPPGRPLRCALHWSSLQYFVTMWKYLAVDHVVTVCVCTRVCACLRRSCYSCTFGHFGGPWSFCTFVLDS